MHVIKKKKKKNLNSESQSRDLIFDVISSLQFLLRLWRPFPHFRGNNGYNKTERLKMCILKCFVSSEWNKRCSLSFISHLLSLYQFYDKQCQHLYHSFSLMSHFPLTYLGLLISPPCVPHSEWLLFIYFIRTLKVIIVSKQDMKQ